MEIIGDGSPDQHLIERTANILQSGDKSQRKKALVELSKVFANAEGEKLRNLYQIASNVIIRGFRDQAETCRETSLKISKNAVMKLEKDKFYIQNLIPALHARLCTDDEPESSEELKLIYVSYISDLLTKYGELLAPYIEEIVSMLVKLVKEPAPEVKKSSSACVIKLLNTLPRESFRFTKAFVAPLINNLTHQHWRVRAATINAIEILMLKGDNKLVPEVMNPLARAFFDDSHNVRLALTRLTGHWLLDLPDRYSFFGSLLPLILTSLSDDNEQVVEEGRQLWEKAGQKFLLENEKDYKDRKDYAPIDLEHYPIGVKRPGLGCRILMENHGYKFLLALGNELGDWNEQVRFKSSQLLVQYTLHAETSITQPLDKIINSVCRAAMNHETPNILNNIKLAAEYMGYFIPPETYCQLIVSHMKEAHRGELFVVAGLVRGSKKNELKPYLNQVATLMTHTTFNCNEQEALLELISSVFQTCQGDSFDIGDIILSSLVSTAGLANGNIIERRAKDLLEEFIKLGGGDRRLVLNSYCSRLLNSLLNVIWTVHCHHQFIFTSIIKNANEIIIENVGLILEILKGALSPENDPEVLLKIIMSVNDLLRDSDKILPQEILISFIKSFLTGNKIFITYHVLDILPLHLKWNPGRSAESIRTIATTALYMCLLKAIPIEKEIDIQGLLPLVISLLEDAASKTRLLALNCINIMVKCEEVNEMEKFYNIVTNVLKRLDDADRKVRETAVNTIKLCYEEHLKMEEDKNYINKSLLEFVYSTLLIHLDDHEQNFRENVLGWYSKKEIIVTLNSDCIKVVGKIDPGLLHSKIQVDKFREKDIGQKLVQFVSNEIKEKIKS